MAAGGATAKSIRALFDLPRYNLVLVERWAGWGRLTLVPKNTGFRCPRCHITVGDGQPCRWRPLRDLDIGQRHIELRVQVYRIQCLKCDRPELPIPLARQYARCTRRLEAHLFRLTGDSTVKAVAKRMVIDW
jgi:transposase